MFEGRKQEDYTKMLEGLKNLFMAPIDESSNDISLEDLITIIGDKFIQYARVGTTYCPNISRYRTVDFEYPTKDLRLTDKDEGTETIIIGNNNGDFYIKGYAYPYLNFLREYSIEIGRAYNAFMNLSKYSELFSLNRTIKSANTPFTISLEGRKLKINGLEISTPYYTGHPRYYDNRCNSSLVLNATYKREDELLKRIFVKIDDCPVSIRQELYNYRLNSLYEKKHQKELKHWY